jgi:hypothetical protein
MRAVISCNMMLLYLLVLLLAAAIFLLLLFLFYIPPAIALLVSNHHPIRLGNPVGSPVMVWAALQSWADERGVSDHQATNNNRQHADRQCTHNNNTTHSARPRWARAQIPRQSPTRPLWPSCCHALSLRVFFLYL